LSENSITEARKQEHDYLHFLVHDMLKPFRHNTFHLVCNLFTSFGYFENETDNSKVFANAEESLLPGGSFVMDYFNSAKVSNLNSAPYIETRGELVFSIGKTIRNKSIVKRIEFTDQGHDYYFEETVNLLKLEDFKKYGAESGLKLKSIFGDYKLEPFDAATSDRLILLFEKP
jgi:SAM-dependent methyltransferase